MPEVHRLFVGVGLSDETRAELTDALQSVALPGRIVPPARWHLTLRFLGDVSAGDIPPLRTALRDVLRPCASSHPLPVVFSGLGAFPRPARAAVLWLGVREGADALRALAARVEYAVQRVGLPPERRPFAPHLTLARLQPPRDVAALLASASAPRCVRATVDTVTLFRSQARRIAGSQAGGHAPYEALEDFPLVAEQFAHA